MASAVKWISVFCGVIAILAVVGICFSGVILFFAMNWATVIEKDQTIIRRITGWRTSSWYVRDGHKESKEFGVWTVRKEEFVLRRSIRKTIVFSEPLWEIYFLGAGDDSEIVISFFPDKTIEVRERANGFRWRGFRLTEEELKQSRFGELVKRAESLQRETEKRFKSLLNSRA